MDNIKIKCFYVPTQHKEYGFQISLIFIFVDGKGMHVKVINI